MIRLDPDQGASVTQGSVVTIWVSTGKEKVQVPSLNGMTLSEAKQTLQNAGLTLKLADGSNSSDDATVDSFSPNAGESVDKGSEVTVKTKAPDKPSPSPSESSSNSGNDNNGDSGNNNGH